MDDAEKEKEMEKARKKVNELNDKINNLLDNNPAYHNLRPRNFKATKSRLLGPKNYDPQDVQDAGRMLFLTTIRHKGAWLRWEFEAKFGTECIINNPDKEKNTEEIGESAEEVIDDLDDRYESLKKDYLELCEQSEKDPFWLESFNGPNNELFDTISSFFSEVDATPIMLSMPFDEFMGEDASKIAEVERYVLGSLRPERDSVKRLAGGFEGVEDARIGVAVTFQTCLHLDVSGKVELFQGLDDVLVRPKG